MTFDRYMWLSIIFLIIALTMTVVTDWKGILERENIPLFVELGNIFGVLFPVLRSLRFMEKIKGYS